MSDGNGYVCTLPKDALKKAKKELNEDPKQRESHIETLRNWIISQPHINSRTDDAFLIRFLRAAKFSQLRAQQILENFWTMRSSPLKGAPDWFENLTPSDPKIQEVLDLGMTIPLPGRDEEGRKVILVRTGAYDPQKIALKDTLRIGFLVNDILLVDELTQVHGVIILLDFMEFSSSHVWYWTRETIQKAMKCWNDTYPMRQKAFHYIYTPTLFNALNEIFLLFAKEKHKQRMCFHKDSLDSLHSKIPKRILPTHLGGDAGDIMDLAKAWKKEAMTYEAEFDLNKGFGVDDSKRPKVEETSSGWGVTGVFRRLNID